MMLMPINTIANFLRLDININRIIVMSCFHNALQVASTENQAFTSNLFTIRVAG